MTEQAQTLSLAAMFMIGLLGSGHCVGMCGGIASALGFATRGRRGVLLVCGYNLGRIASYSMAGALAALAGYWGSSYLSLGPALRIAAGVILILMGLYLAGWWRVLVHLEKTGARLWRHIQPLGKKVMPVNSLAKALALGMVWGWLPCGLVYTALVYAATSGSAVDGTAMMAAFGLGTAPAMIAGGVFSRSLAGFLQARPVRLLMALAMIVFGLWTLASVAAHWQHGSSVETRGASGQPHHHHH